LKEEHCDHPGIARPLAANGSRKLTADPKFLWRPKKSIPLASCASKRLARKGLANFFDARTDVPGGDLGCLGALSLWKYRCGLDPHDFDVRNCHIRQSL
jgi:hypothetical protein